MAENPIPQPGERRPPDVVTAPMATLAWDEERALPSLEKAYELAVSKARDAIRWYLIRKKGHQRGARILRLGAIVMTSAGGLIPLLSEIFKKANGTVVLSPAWSAVALGLAVSMIGLDKFFGCSSAWVRYITTELKIQEVLDTFEVEWQIDRAAWPAGRPDDAQRRAALERIKSFLARIDGLILEETGAWVAEFTSVLAKMEESAKPRKLPAAAES